VLDLTEIITFVFENISPPSSGPRKLVVRMAGHTFRIEDVEKRKACFPTEFLLDMFRRTLEHVASDCPASTRDTYESQKWLKTYVCQEFHEHNFHLSSAYAGRK
jgi:hypothetical protein